MTVLNNTSDGTANVLLVLARVLRQAEQPIEREKLIRICSVNDDIDRPRKTLTRWMQLGLFEETKAGIEFSQPISDLIFAPTENWEFESLLATAVRRIIFEPKNNSNLWKEPAPGASDLTRPIAWSLAQDVYRANFQGWAATEKLENSQLNNSDKIILRTDFRFNEFKKWTTFLGFYRPGSRGQIDPTVAIRDTFRVLFSKNDTLPIQRLLAELREELPVLDEGKYRKTIEKELNRAAWTGAAERGRLSSSLSLALIRLETLHVIEIPSPSADAKERVSLIGYNGQELRNITHVKYLGDTL
jgi:hypothetical protein